MIKTATKVRELDGWGGDAALYQLSEPIKYSADIEDTPAKTCHVIVSAIGAFGSGPETYIFPADKKGTCLDYGELDGSFQGGMDHEEALRGAGYEIAAAVTQ